MLNFIFFLEVLAAFNSIGNAHKGVPILRVVGGQYTSLRDYPHSVFLKIGSGIYYYTCGGSILTSRAILTAAHCYADAPKTKSLAYIGHVNYVHAPQIIPIIKAVVHEKYAVADKNSFNYDITILYTNTSIKFSQDVKKVVLGTKTYRADTIAYMAGWGQTTAFNQIPDLNDQNEYLKAVHQHIIDQYVCAGTFEGFTSNMMCAGRNTPEERVFKGDSGSALVVDGFIQIGLVSYGLPSETATTVFTNIVPLRDWIKKTVLRLRSMYCKAV